MTVTVIAMHTRRLLPGGRSFFLFGPRGTGKTTWLRAQFPRARWFDLASEPELVRLLRSLESLTQEIEALPRSSWVVIDEIQRLPALLNQVQDIIARHGDRYRFALTGSSARRLRRENAKLLPGRLVNRHFYPLTISELGDRVVPPNDLVAFGMLPAVRPARNERDRRDLLERLRR